MRAAVAGYRRVGEALAGAADAFLASLDAAPDTSAAAAPDASPD
ncbi:hypothetical protein GCM10022245_61200 [Streptomyces mayteni]